MQEDPVQLAVLVLVDHELERELRSLVVPEQPMPRRAVDPAAVGRASRASSTSFAKDIAYEVR
ncbi:hypothetical protein H4N58_08125 [Mumia sp. ZJ1417]|uniref:hypothetical protein n=1 Tax=Mumia sp. ZJ1417 TaxID=2708082 RepID=UPI001421339D|nr:hypothetical protein [Mumia sp. ZJ1417]QMW67811.1 hypothetical protein H4N58_08125 [Mumia sp. ZJ1417]